MEDLKKERELFKLREVEQLKLSQIIWERERKEFRYVDIQSYIAETKNNDDLSVLMEKLSEWSIATSKDLIKGKMYLDLLKCIYRVQSYCFNLQTVAQQSIALWNTSESKNTDLEHKFRKMTADYIFKQKELESKLEIATKEIKFLTKQ